MNTFGDCPIFFWFKDQGIKGSLLLTYMLKLSAQILSLLFILWSYSNGQDSRVAGLPADTTRINVRAEGSPSKDSTLSAKQINDSLNDTLTARPLVRPEPENTLSLWDIIGRIELLVGLLSTPLVLVLLMKLVKSYNLRSAPYLTSIVKNFAEYEPYDEIELTLAPDEERHEAGSANLSTTISAVIRKIPAIQILGKPGSGKTTSLKKLLRMYASEQLKTRWWGKILPVYIEYRGDSLFSQMLHFLHVNGLGGDFKYLDEKWLRNQLAKGKFLVLIDDVHKILGNPDSKDNANIQELLEYRQNRFVLMSRDFFRRSDFGFPVYHVSTLTDQKVKSILVLHTSESNAEMISNHLRWNVKVRELYGTPQMLSFLAKVFETYGRIPRNKSTMFAQFFDQQIIEEELKGAKYPKNLKVRILGQLALSMLQNEEDPYRIDEQEGLRTVNKALSRLKSTYGYSAPDSADILNELLKAGSIIRIDRTISFTHDQWQEYFAASEIFQQDIGLESLRHLGSFNELVYFIAGFHSLEGNLKVKEKCRTFLRQLIRFDFFLFSKCLENFKGEGHLTLSYWHDVYKDIVFSVGDIERAYGEFLKDYIGVIKLHFPHLLHKFSPRTENEIGIFVEKSDSHPGCWYAFFELEPQQREQVVVVERSKMAFRLGINDNNKLFEAYAKQYGTRNFKAKDIDPVLFRLPLIGAHDEIENQLKELVQGHNLVEPIEMMQEKIYHEVIALKRTLGIGKDNNKPTVKDISDGLRRRRIRESIQRKFLSGSSVDVRALEEETERLFHQGLIPEQRRGSTTFAGIYSRTINDIDFENSFTRFVREMGLKDDSVIVPPLAELPRDYFYEKHEARSNRDKEIMIAWSADYYRKLFTNYKETIEANFPTSASSFEHYAHFPIVIALVVDDERFQKDGWLGARHIFGNVKKSQKSVTVEVLTKEEFPEFEKTLYAHRWHHFPHWLLPDNFPNEEYLRNGVYDLIRREYDKLTN